MGSAWVGKALIGRVEATTTDCVPGLSHALTARHFLIDAPRPVGGSADQYNVLVNLSPEESGTRVNVDVTLKSAVAALLLTALITCLLFGVFFWLVGAPLILTVAFPTMLLVIASASVLVGDWSRAHLAARLAQERLTP